MTCREKLAMEHPEEICEDYTGGCYGCPHHYQYMERPEQCSFGGSGKVCTDCWDREIPVTSNFADSVTQAGKIAKEAEENIQRMAEAVKEMSVEVEPVILDSGDRTQFESGAVRDMREGKGRMDLLPWAAIMEVSKHCENGAKKYGEHNVDKGIPTSSLCDSAARHLAKYLDGWTDENHLLSAAWNLLWALQMHIKHPEVVDTPWKRENTINTPKE